MRVLAGIICCAALACAAPAPAPSPPAPSSQHTPIDAAGIRDADAAPRDAAVVDAAVTTAAHDAAVAPTLPPPPPQRPPAKVVRVAFRMSDMDEDGEKRCKKALKGCKHVFVQLEAPPSPCANQGTRCVTPSKPPTGWLCTCAECDYDFDCGKGNHCATLAGACPAERVAGTCQPGPQEPYPVCPAAPEGRLRSQPGGTAH